MKQEKTSQDPEGNPLPRNWLTPVLLLILREWRSYGYDLMERLEAFGFAALDHGSIYRALRQMEQDGMVSSSWDTTGAGPARRMYSITDAGEAYLKLWTASLDHYQKVMNAFFQIYTGQSQSKEQTHGED